MDGVPYVAGLLGDEAFARRTEDDPSAQWIRIGATIMLLPDVLVGEMRSMVEIGKLGQEADEASVLAASSRDGADAARARAAKIHHPERHPRPLSRRLHRAHTLAAAAAAQSQAAEEAAARLRMVAGRDIAVFQGGTLAGTALLTAAPPGIVLSDEQKRRDEQYEKSLAPKGGMPKDVRLEMRVTSHTRNAP